uniref:LPXTG cell wall anchor domain-containing protein n=1 Tax=uncultured Draconibacterium sp. TaxID=1573823 RepID=UPI003216A94B
MKRVIALIGLFIMSLPTLLMAQDQGTYIDNLGAQDSSYMDEDLLADVGQQSGSNTTVIIIVVAVVVIAAAAFFFLKKKKK